MSATREMVSEDDFSEQPNASARPAPRSVNAPRETRVGAVSWGRLVGMFLLLAAVGGGGTWAYLEYLAPKDSPVVESADELPEVQPVLVSDYQATSGSRAIERVRPTADATVVQALPDAPVATVSREDYDGRSAFLMNKGVHQNFNLLSPEVAPDLPEDGLPTVSEAEETDETDTRAPGGRQDMRRALASGVYPESNLPKIEYWKLLRNQLLLRNKKGEVVGSQIDLEKAWLLLSLYYNPRINVDEIRGYLSRLTSELRDRLIEQDADGEISFKGSESERVRSVITFLLDGNDVSGGWDVQEYHPGIRELGTMPYQQNYLIDSLFANGLKARNQASNTALNMLALVLLRKLEFDVDGNGKKIGLKMPLYGMRLPDRTILRHDARGANAILLSREERSRDETRSFDDPSLSRITPDYRGYTRNIELIRNGNHYDAEEYRRRYQISLLDGQEGIYLRTLTDRKMFASMGYELAMADIMMARQVESTNIAEMESRYDRAQRFLTEWVLDRDDGTGTGFMRKALYRPNHPQPRGDLLLRDAHILLAELFLQRADYPAIAKLIENDFALSSDGERAQTLRALLARSRKAIEGARASFEDVMDFDPNNPFANLYLGEFDFLTADASLPAVYKWKSPEQISNLDAALANALNQDIDKIASSIKYFDVAEANDFGRLNGVQRHTLHLHRGLAYEQRGREGDLIRALADLERAAEVKPEFGNSADYENISRRLRYRRIFQVLENKAADSDGQLMYDAISFLRKNLKLKKELRFELERSIEALGQIKNIAIQWELVNVLKGVTGKDFGRNPTLWKNWVKDYFKRTGVKDAAVNKRQYNRAFRVITGSSREYELDQKRAAIEYIRNNLRLDHDNRVNIERTVDALGSFEGRAVKDDIVGTLRKLTGQDIGNDPEAWRKWVNEYFRRNP